MHELSLYAQIPASQHSPLLHQLTGFAAIQPRRTFTRHLIFKTRMPSAAQPLQAGGSQDKTATEAQKINRMLNGGLYYVQLVGEVEGGAEGLEDVPFWPKGLEGDASAPGKTNAEKVEKPHFTKWSWKMEFKDTPEAGTRLPVSSRLCASVHISSGDVLRTMSDYGLDYVSEYIIEGHLLVHNNTNIHLYRPLQIPPAQAATSPPAPMKIIPPYSQLVPLDPSGAHVLQISLRVQDGGNPEMMRIGAQELMGSRQALRSVVKLEAGERLALDAKVKA